MSNLFGLLGGMSIWALAAAAALRQHPLYLPVPVPRGTSKAHARRVVGTELDSGTSVAPSRYGAVTPFVEITFAVGLLIGFVLGYGARAFISYRRRQAARRRRAL
jgi:hypothetical protein